MIGTKVNKIVFFQDLPHNKTKINNNPNLSLKASGKPLNNQKFNDINDQEVRSIFENINKKIYENN